MTQTQNAAEPRPAVPPLRNAGQTGGLAGLGILLTLVSMHNGWDPELVGAAATAGISALAWVGSKARDYAHAVGGDVGRLVKALMLLG